MLPNDRDTEMCVLGTLIRYNEHYHKVSDMLSPTAFFDVALSNVYRCVSAILDGGGITDINSIVARGKALRIDIDRALLAQIIVHCSEPTLLQDVARLHALDVQRRLWQTFTTAASRVIEPVADVDAELESVGKAIADIQGLTTDDGIATFADSFAELSAMVDANREGRHEYIETGFAIFDRFYLLRPQTLSIIAAFTSVGKSALAMNIAVRAAKNGSPVAYYSLEMGKAELAARSVSKLAQMTAGHILNGRLNDTERIVYQDAAAAFVGLPIYIDERSTVSFDRTMRSIRALVKTRGVRLAVIDYLQIYAQNGERVEEGLAAMCRTAKNVAKECGIAILLLSQLNRSDKHPSLRMLRGSGQIEESADNVILIDRPAAYPDGGNYSGKYANESTKDTALLILAKGRGVGIGDELVGFDSDHTTFYPLNRDKKPQSSFDSVDWDRMIGGESKDVPF